MQRFAAIVVVLCGCGTGTGEVPGLPPSANSALAAPTSTTEALPSAPTLNPHDVWVLHDRLVACLMAPVTCDVDSLAAVDSPAHRQLTLLIERRGRARLEASAPRHPPRRTLMRSWPTGDAWQVELCWVDDLVLHEASDSSSSPIVVDDNTLTLHERWNVTRTTDGWRVTTRTIVDMTPGVAPWCR